MSGKGSTHGLCLMSNELNLSTVLQCRICTDSGLGEPEWWDLSRGFHGWQLGCLLRCPHSCGNAGWGHLLMSPLHPVERFSWGSIPPVHRAYYWRVAVEGRPFFIPFEWKILGISCNPPLPEGDFGLQHDHNHWRRRGQRKRRRVLWYRGVPHIQRHCGSWLHERRH